MFVIKKSCEKSLLFVEKNVIIESWDSMSVYLLVHNILCFKTNSRPYFLVFYIIKKTKRR